MHAGGEFVWEKWEPIKDESGEMRLNAGEREMNFYKAAGSF
jgi:hypothetical protein